MYNASVTPSSSILSGLNPPQREAVETTSGPVLIIAGPGSGKTRVITHRIAYLVDHCDVSPSGIAALTFTIKAAREMKSRMNALLQARCEQVTVSTFHAFCAMVLRRDGTALDIKNDFTIYDSIDQISALKKALQEADGDIKIMSYTSRGSTRHGLFLYEHGGTSASDGWTIFHDDITLYFVLPCSLYAFKHLFLFFSSDTYDTCIQFG